MGVIAAWKHRTWVDYLVMSFSVLGFSVPVFLVGYVLLLIFSVKLGWLPPQGFKPLSAGIAPFMERAILPALTLASIYIALIARMTRAAMLDVLNEDYIRTARAKGVGDRRLLFVHALKNAAVPIATIVGAGFALLISGVVVTETIFNIPGIDAADRRCGAGARLSRHSGADPADRHALRRRQPVDRPVLFAV